MDVGEKDAKSALVAKAAAIAAQAMQQQFAQQQQFQQQHEQQFFVHPQQALQMMFCATATRTRTHACRSKYQLNVGPDGPQQQPAAIDPKKQIFAGMKGALAIELEPVEETLALMREVCGPAATTSYGYQRPAVPKTHRVA